MFIAFKVDKATDFYTLIQEWNAKMSIAGQYLSPTRYTQIKDEYFGVKIKPMIPKEIFIVGLCLTFVASLIFGAVAVTSIFMIIFGFLLLLYTPLPYIAGIKMRLKREKKDIMINYKTNTEILEMLMEDD